jgi:hypothetical protein
MSHRGVSSQNCVSSQKLTTSNPNGVPYAQAADAAGGDAGGDAGMGDAVGVRNHRHKTVGNPVGVVEIR